MRSCLRNSNQGLVLRAQSGHSVSYDEILMPFLHMVLTVARPAPAFGVAGEQLLTARVEFTMDQTLFDFGASGEFVDDSKVHKLRQMAADKRGTSAEVAARLASLGARFGPDGAAEMRAEALRCFERLATVLGPIELADLGLLDDGSLWKAEIWIMTPVGPRPYGVIFEPFEGRHVLTRRVNAH